MQASGDSARLPIESAQPLVVFAPPAGDRAGRALSAVVVLGFPYEGGRPRCSAGCAALDAHLPAARPPARPSRPSARRGGGRLRRPAGAGAGGAGDPRRRAGHRPVPDRRHAHFQGEGRGVALALLGSLAWCSASALRGDSPSDARVPPSTRRSSCFGARDRARRRQPAHGGVGQPPAGAQPVAAHDAGRGRGAPARGRGDPRRPDAGADRARHDPVGGAQGRGRRAVATTRAATARGRARAGRAQHHGPARRAASTSARTPWRSSTSRPRSRAACRCGSAATASRCSSRSSASSCPPETAGRPVPDRPGGGHQRRAPRRRRRRLDLAAPGGLERRAARDRQRRRLRRASTRSAPRSPGTSASRACASARSCSTARSTSTTSERGTRVLVLAPMPTPAL